MSTPSGRFSLDIAIRDILTATVGSKGVKEHRYQAILDLANGTADGQINKVYSKVETGIGASVTTVRDLVGSLTDEEGSTLNFDEVVLLAVRNLSSTAANYLSIGPDATAGFGVVASNRGFFADASDRLTLPADGGDAWVVVYSKAGIPAAAATTDELAIITQSATSANTWELLVLGRDNP